MWNIAQLCFTFLSLGVQFAAAATPKIDIDQISNRTDKGGATNFATWNKAQQSFAPHLSHLDFIEVEITPGNSGPATKVRLKILDGDQLISTKELVVQPDFSGALRFDLFGEHVELTPGSRYWIRLEEDVLTFFWKYDTPSPYADGEAYFYSHPIVAGVASSFRFRTAGH